jgi:hypothetical protein
MTTRYHITLAIPNETFFKILGEHLRAHHFPHMISISNASVSQLDDGQFRMSLDYETDEEAPQ